MKTSIILLIALVLSSCASSPKKPEFSQDRVCSDASLKYLNSPKNKSKKPVQSAELEQILGSTTLNMQQCYLEYQQRKGKEEFDTCLVVGVNARGKTEFYNFSSKEITDEKFIDCAHRITMQIPFGNFGKNYILVQSYQFYYQ